MPNGLNGQFISQLPQFQQNVTGFNQFNQLSSTNFQQLATTAAGTFQSPNSQQPNANDMVMTGRFSPQYYFNSNNIKQIEEQNKFKQFFLVDFHFHKYSGVAGQNIQFTAQQTPINVSVAQSIPSSQIIAVPSQQPQLISTPEPMRNPTPITLIPQVSRIL